MTSYVVIFKIMTLDDIVSIKLLGILQISAIFIKKRLNNLIFQIILFFRNKRFLTNLNTFPTKEYITVYFELFSKKTC